MFLNLAFYLVGCTVRAVAVDEDYLCFPAHFWHSCYNIFDITALVSAGNYYGYRQVLVLIGSGGGTGHKKIDKVKKSNSGNQREKIITKYRQRRNPLRHQKERIRSNHFEVRQPEHVCDVLRRQPVLVGKGPANPQK